MIGKLQDLGADVRACSSQRIGSGRSKNFRCLHAKTWLIDEVVYIGGSSNSTQHSLSNNEENLLIIEEDGVIAKYLGWWATMWQSAGSYGGWELHHKIEEIKARSDR